MWWEIHKMVKREENLTKDQECNRQEYHIHQYYARLIEPIHDKLYISNFELTGKGSRSIFGFRHLD